MKMRLIRVLLGGALARSAPAAFSLNNYVFTLKKQ
jgi:hypothetical protein